MKKLLVALDASSRAPLVLESAATIARATGAELYLLRAIGLPPDLPKEAFGLSPEELIERWKKEAVRDLEAKAAMLPSELVVHVLVRIGSPWSAICAAGREHEVDV